MASCPCCGNQLLRHIRGNQTYWFCRNCWQEMPLLSAEIQGLLPIHRILELGVSQPSNRLLAEV